MNANELTKGTKLHIASQHAHGNGTWLIYNTRADEAHLARLGLRGQVLKPNADNMMTVPVAVLVAGINAGTIRVIA